MLTHTGASDESTLRRLPRICALMIGTLALAACAHAPAARPAQSSALTTGSSAATTAYAGLGTPEAALATFFDSARAQDYSATYDAYYDAYQKRVTRSDFVRHRKAAAVLREYTIDSLSDNGASAEASVTLIFASTKPGGSDRTVTVHESLVRQGSEWRIKVW